MFFPLLAGGLLIALSAFEFDADPLFPFSRFEDPSTIGQRRLMANVLKMAAFKFRPPVTFIVVVKRNDLLLHCRASGFHQRMIDRAISQQTAEAATSGTSCSYS